MKKIRRKSAAAERRSAKNQQEWEERQAVKAAARLEAAKLIVARIGDALPELLSLMDAAGSLTKSDLEEAAFGKKPEIWLPAILGAGWMCGLLKDRFRHFSNNIKSLPRIFPSL
jgi:hypothetical protein